jgi:hypothetical protein
LRLSRRPTSAHVSVAQANDLPILFANLIWQESSFQSKPSAGPGARHRAVHSGNRD